MRLGEIPWENIRLLRRESQTPNAGGRVTVLIFVPGCGILGGWGWCLLGSLCVMRPCDCLRELHECLVSGQTERIGDYFSFSSAYRYWRDIATSLGAAVPEEADFTRTLEALFASSLVRGEVSSYTPGAFREKIMGRVASVVFERTGSGGTTGVASLVLEDGCWKVRTCPGIFPGELLSRVLSRTA